MRTLSKEAEDKLITAVKQAAVAVDNGEHPTEAVEKIAREQQWGPEMIRFATYALNTGRQTAQRESSDNALDKFAEFALADADEVIERIFPAKVKTAADVACAGVSADYARPPAWPELQAAESINTRLRNFSMSKAASVPPPIKPPAEPMKDVYNRFLMLKQAAEHARYLAGDAYDKAIAAMGTAAEYFRKAAMDRLPFAHVEAAVNTVHGRQGRLLMDWIYQRNNMKEARFGKTKLASLVSYDASTQPYAMLERCLKLAAEVTAAQESHEKAAETLERFVMDKMAVYVSDVKTEKSAWALIAQPDRRVYDMRTLRMFLPHRIDETIKVAEAKPAATLTAPVEAWSLLKAAGPLGGAAVGAASAVSTKELLDKALGGTSEDRTQSALNDLDDPAHDAELQQIQTQAMLTQLMNDEVIGGFPPEQVMSAYNEIAQLAPRTSRQPLPVRSLLRQHLQRGAEPFESKEITEIEKGIKDTSAPVPAPAPRMKAAMGLLDDDSETILI